MKKILVSTLLLSIWRVGISQDTSIAIGQMYTNSNDILELIVVGVVNTDRNRDLLQDKINQAKAYLEDLHQKGIADESTKELLKQINPQSRPKVILQ